MKRGDFMRWLHNQLEIENQHFQNTSVAEMKMLRWKSGITKDRLRNECISNKLEVTARLGIGRGKII